MLVRPADAAAIAAACQHLQAGEPVVLPTETVYGLAADATNGAAVARVYELKGRPAFNPLICHVDGIEAAERLGRLDSRAVRLAAQFWPGPLTLVLEQRPGHGVASLATAGLPTVAIRAPSHPVFRAVLSALGAPLAAPSANRSGQLSPTRAEHALLGFATAPGLILDAGPCAHGLESTIVRVLNDGVALLRPGPISAEQIEAAAGARLIPHTGAQIAAPGMLASHYAPHLPLRLDAAQAEPDCYHIGFGMITGDRNLSPGGDLIEAASRLFDLLHMADSSGRAAIAVAPIPDIGLGQAINDRLRRAAAPRPAG